MNIRSILLIAMFMAIVSYNATAETFKSEAGIYYETINNTDVKVVKSPDGYSGDITIPSKVGNNGKTYNVVEINDYAFHSNKGVKSVFIHGSVKKIGYCAFEYCENLSDITLEEGVEYIDSYAFSGCTPEILAIPGTVTHVGSSGFGCATIQHLIFMKSSTPLDCVGGWGSFNSTSLSLLEYYRPMSADDSNNLRVNGSPVKYIAFGENVQYVPSNFANACKSLEKIEFGGNEVSINSYAFQNCKALKEVSLPDACRTIGYCAFEYCDALQNVTLNNVTYLDSYAFNKCGIVNLTIPSNVTHIGSSTFNCSTIEYLTFEAGSTPLEVDYGWGSFNFSSLKELKYGRPMNDSGNITVNGSPVESIILSDEVKFIPKDFANGCDKLKNIEFGGNEKEIQKYGFQNCKSLEKVTFPPKMTTLGYCAFEYCDALTDISLNNGLEYIDSYAFNGCTPTEITIPNSVTHIGSSSFSCTTLENITFEKGEKELDVQSGWSSFKFSSLKHMVWGRPFKSEDNGNMTINDSPVETIVFSEYTKYIPASFAKNCKKLRYVKFGGNETSIGSYAFQSCPIISTSEDNNNIVEIPESFKEIGYCAFEYCYDLKKVIIGINVEKIENYAFGSDKALEEVCVYNPEPPTVLGESAFTSEAYKNATLYVPVGSEGKYQDAAVWKKFYNVKGSGITSAVMDASGMRVVGCTLLNDNKSLVYVYTSAGALVYSGQAREIPLPACGIYLVKIGDTVSKVIVK